MSLKLEMFVNFNRTCREAVTFYADVFGLAMPEIMTYAQAGMNEPGEADKVMYAALPIGGHMVMFMDIPKDMEPGFSMRSSITLTLSSQDMDEMRRLFGALSAGGEVQMPLEKTFWSDLYGCCTDKFGVCWQVSHDSGRY